MLQSIVGEYEVQLLYLCLKFACAVLLLNQFSNSLHTHASLRIICIMGVDCLAVDPLLPAEVLCTSALTLIIGTYGPRQEEHPPVLAFKSAGRSDFPTKPASFMKDHRCRAHRLPDLTLASRHHCSLRSIAATWRPAGGHPLLEASIQQMIALPGMACPHRHRPHRADRRISA